MRKWRQLFFISLGLLFIAEPLNALPPFKVPTLSGSVVDEVGLLSGDEAGRLKLVLKELKEKSGVQMAVLIPESLQDLEIEDYSIKVVEAWKLGETKTDFGLLFLLAPKERKMRLEVGYGLEGEIPDAYAKQILSDIVRPRLKSGNTYSAIVSAVYRVAEIKGVKLTGQLDSHKMAKSGGSGFGLLFLFGLMILLMMMGVNPFSLLFLLSGGGGRGGFGGGDSSGGGGFSGGGGGFGGGGASSDW